MTAKASVVVHHLQDKLAALLGSGPEARTPLVGAMLRRSPTESTSYWLQLVVSMGIATLGLVLGSTAVIIGAMLVAPLMVPIVGLAMGLATGSPFLVLRSAARVISSVVLVIFGAAAITVLLPFHELNAEIAARTTPTVLDLLVAAFCALAAVYATLRPGSDTTATAAGTAISISLVPPLCASGYGVGTTDWSVASGAALLFLTNFVAIVAVGTVSFVAAGFNLVHVETLEYDEVNGAGSAPVSRAIARRLQTMLGSRSGIILRLLMPFALLAAVYFPLSRALEEVAWEVRVRLAARHAIAAVKQPIVQSRVNVERHRVNVAVVLLGTSGDAEAARRHLEHGIRPASEVSPHVEVIAIPDAESFAGLESTLRAPIVPPAPPLTAAENLDSTRRFMSMAIDKYWPVDAAGQILVADMGVTGSPMTVQIVHHGESLPAAAAEVFERSIAEEAAQPVRIKTSAIPIAPIVATNGAEQFIAELTFALEAARAVDGMAVCVTQPPESKGGRKAAAVREMSARVLTLLEQSKRVVMTPGEEWQVRFVRGSCETAQDGGAPDAGLREGGVDAGAPP